jgi:hypothetical protein
VLECSEEDLVLLPLFVNAPTLMVGSAKGNEVDRLI